MKEFQPVAAPDVVLSEEVLLGLDRFPVVVKVLVVLTIPFDAVLSTSTGIPFVGILFAVDGGGGGLVFEGLAHGSAVGSPPKESCLVLVGFTGVGFVRSGDEALDGGMLDCSLSMYAMRGWGSSVSG